MNASKTQPGGSVVLEMSGTEGLPPNFDSKINGTARNKINPECNDVSGEDASKTSAIRELWNGFVENTTLHGLSYVVTGKSRIRRILWAVFLLTAIAFFSYQSISMLKKYFSFPNTTKVSLKYDSMPDFPAVTICNFNMFRSSVVKNLTSLGLGGATYENVDFSTITNNTQFLFDAGHQINDTMHSCLWGGKQTCDYRNFTPVLTNMGLCHTFNSGMFWDFLILTSLLFFFENPSRSSLFMQILYFRSIRAVICVILLLFSSRSIITTEWSGTFAKTQRFNPCRSLLRLLFDGKIHVRWNCLL